MHSRGINTMHTVYLLCLFKLHTRISISLALWLDYGSASTRLAKVFTGHCNGYCANIISNCLLIMCLSFCLLKNLTLCVFSAALQFQLKAHLCALTHREIVVRCDVPCVCVCVRESFKDIHPRYRKRVT